MNSSVATTKRQSSAAVLATVARPPCDLHPTVIIADKAVLSGTFCIKVGEGSVIHPYAKLAAEHGQIVIGKNCTIAEGVSIISSEQNNNGQVLIEDGVRIEAGTQVAAASIGEGSEIGPQAAIDARVIIGKYCKVAAKQKIVSGEQLDNFTVILGDGSKRINETLRANEMMCQAKTKAQERHIETLRRLIPNAAARWTAE